MKLKIPLFVFQVIFAFLVGEKEDIEVYTVILHPWLILNTSPSSLLDNPHSGAERRENPFDHRSFEIRRSLRRLGGRSVWSRTIGLLPKSRSSELRSLSLHKPQSSYCGHPEIARRFSYKRLKSTSVKIERKPLPDKTLDKRAAR